MWSVFVWSSGDRIGIGRFPVFVRLRIGRLL